MVFPLLHTFLLTSIPDELTARESLLTPAVGVGLFVAFVVISIAKLLKSDIFTSLILSNVKTVSLYAYIRESHPLNKGGSLLLVLNYLISFGLVLYIISGFSNLDLTTEIAIVLVVPFALLAWSLCSMMVVGLITGERRVFSEPFAMKLVGVQFLGLFYFVVALVLSLHPFGSQFFISIVIWAFIVETIVRLLKSIRVVYSKGVPWYYIILYFCTLEILPLFVAYYLLLRDFE